MKLFVAAVLLVCAVALPLTTPVDGSTLALFSEFMTSYNKTYSNAVEESIRLQNFVNSLERVRSKNAAEGSEVYGITKFSDLSVDEFRQFLGYRKRVVHENLKTVAELPRTSAKVVDWRTTGAVTPVKDQGYCGSCWAFSAVEQIESAWFLAGNTMVELSEQQVVSCDREDYGCNGGDTMSAFDYVIEAGGIESEKEYPYVDGVNRKCQYEKSKAVAHISDYKMATKKHDEDLMASTLAANGPLSVCVEAETWMDYSKGIVTKNCGRDLDHCVQVVGFDQSVTTPYWMVRNSWAEDWGIDGYIHIAMGKNLCGIADEAILVTV